jgi:2-succinyl-5-enolpyruvyl-6-hydroxy-3-cyclohexene-1-carboxylate synthase
MNHSYLDNVFDILVEYGVKDVCIGAGSRSTAMLQSLLKHNVNIHPFFDERAVGFMALGIQKATQSPVMIVTTSGTAVNNLGPALTEAQKSLSNLIVCTADRPSRLHQTSANQTINQRNVFNQVISELHLPEDAKFAKEFFLNFNKSLQHQAINGGVIHLNCPLEDPVTNPYKSTKSNSPYAFEGVSYPPYDELDMNRINRLIRSSQRPLLCIGQLEPSISRTKMLDFVKALSWPTVVDGTNFWLKGLPNVIISANDAYTDLNIQKFDVILYVGGGFVSKKMPEFLTKNKAIVHHVSPGYLPVFPALNTYRLDLTKATPTRYRSDNLSWLRHLNSKILKQQKEKALTNNEFDMIAKILDSKINQKIDLFVGNSLPIRYVDQLKIDKIRYLFCNRGASGIDGNIATISGLAMAYDKTPLLAIIGDLTALYDLNAFLLLQSVKRPLNIIIINNRGGKIFESLPVAESYPFFDAHFKLSHKIFISPILKSMGLNCTHHSDTSSIVLKFDGQVFELLP